MKLIETVLVCIAITIFLTFVLYEVCYVVFFDNTSRSSEKEKKGGSIPSASAEVINFEDVLVQPKPLGYSKITTKKFEQCATPVFELNNIDTAAILCKVETGARKDSLGNNKKKVTPPCIVVTSPTF